MINSVGLTRAIHLRDEARKFAKLVADGNSSDVDIKNALHSLVDIINSVWDCYGETE